MFLFLYRLFCGYLYVRVTAENYEKILNLCAAKGIELWRVTTKNGKLYFKIGIRSFKRLRIFKRKVPCRIHITKKVGLPFFVLKNKKRLGMPIGVVVFFLILHLMSGSVWNVCISGNKDIPTSEIALALKDIGICEGTRISKIDPEQKRYELLLRQSGLSWAAINIEGSKVTVDVTETQKSDDSNTSPSNLKATEDGIIRKIQVKSGVTEVEVGETVQKGQLLVSGINEYDDGTFDLKRSVGNIYAEVEYNLTITQPLTVTENLKTGAEHKRSVLSFFGVTIPLYLGRLNGEYETDNPLKTISKGESYLPIRIITKRFYELEKITHTITEEQALKRAEASAKKELSRLVGKGEILTEKREKRLNDGELRLKIKIKCLKDIVFEEKLQLDTRN